MGPATTTTARPTYQQPPISYASPKKTVAPSTQNSYNAYDVALKVEETYASPEEEEDQDVYFIFYEDNQETKESPPPPAPSPLQGYISEAASVPPDSNQFKPPSDIRTIYVPYENAVNVPDIFDVSVGA